MLESPFPARYKTFNSSSQNGCKTPLPLSILYVLTGYDGFAKFQREYSLPCVLLNPTLKKYPVEPSQVNF